MITVAVIGILAAIALPAYQSYVNRAKMSEGIVQLGALRSAIVEEFATRGFPDQERLDDLLPTGSPTSLVAELFGEIDAYSVSGGTCSLPAQASPQARANVCGNDGTSGGIVRLVARMDAGQFSGMVAEVNDQIALEGYVMGGQILWFCRPDATRGVKADWVPSTCRS